MIFSLSFKKYILLLSFILAFSACIESDVTSPTVTDALALSFILNPHAKRQKALLTYVNSLENKYSPAPTLADGAEFYINNNVCLGIPPDSLVEQCQRWAYSPDSCYNYYLDNFDFSRTDTCRLRISLGDKAIQGATLVPGAYELSAKNRHIFWTRSRNAVYYRLSIDRKIPYLHRSYLTDQLSLDLDDATFPAGMYNVTIDAFEENAYNFFKGVSFVAGVSGGYGVFGAVRTEKMGFEIF